MPDCIGEIARYPLQFGKYAVAVLIPYAELMRSAKNRAYSISNRAFLNVSWKFGPTAAFPLISFMCQDGLFVVFAFAEVFEPATHCDQ